MLGTSQWKLSAPGTRGLDGYLAFCWQPWKWKMSFWFSLSLVRMQIARKPHKQLQWVGDDEASSLLVLVPSFLYFFHEAALGACKCSAGASTLTQKWGFSLWQPVLLASSPWPWWNTWPSSKVECQVAWHPQHNPRVESAEWLGSQGFSALPHLKISTRIAKSCKNPPRQWEKWYLTWCLTLKKLITRCNEAWRTNAPCRQVSLQMTEYLLPIPLKKDYIC